MGYTVILYSIKSTVLSHMIHFASSSSHSPLQYKNHLNFKNPLPCTTTNQFELKKTPEIFQKTAEMCKVIRKMHQRCCHVHSLELLTPCNPGFDYRAGQCYIGKNEVLFTEITGDWPLCCVPCLEMKQDRLKPIIQEKANQAQSSDNGTAIERAEPEI